MKEVNRCRCGREIPFEPERKKQPRYCATCRAMFGANKQKGRRKKAKKKRLTLARQTQTKFPS